MVRAENVEVIYPPYCYSREDAVAQDPSGAVCGDCHAVNDFWDDCGWFYVELPAGYLAICQTCWRAGGYTTCER